MGQCWPLQMPPSPKAVLMSLADQANDSGVCWPAVGTICNRTCLGERTVQAAIKWLVETGVLLVNRTPGRSTNYQINPAGFRGTGDLFTAPARGAPPQQRHPRSNGTTPPQQPHPTPANAAGDPRNKGTQNHKEPSVKQEKKFDAAAIDLPEWLDRELWARWVNDRRVRKKPITPDAAELQIGQLAEYRKDGHSPKVVIERAIAGGYQGLFPPTTKPGQVSTGDAESAAARAHEQTQRLLREKAEHAAEVERQRLARKAKETA